MLHEHWNHRAHLGVASCLVFEDPVAALDNVRTGIQRLNAHFNIPQTPEGGYHETLTRCWVVLIRSLLAQDPCQTREALANTALEQFSDKAYLLLFYTRERIISSEARYGWLEPDLQPLPLVGPSAAP